MKTFILYILACTCLYAQVIGNNPQASASDPTSQSCHVTSSTVLKQFGGVVYSCQGAMGTTGAYAVLPGGSGGTITAVNPGTGLAGGGSSGSVDLSLAAQANNTFLANVSGMSASPVPISPSAAAAILPLANSGIGVTGTGGANTLVGPNNALPIINSSGASVDGTAAVYANNGKTFLRDIISIKDYVNNPPLSTYVPTRLSTLVNFAVGNVTVTSSSTSFSCSDSRCALTSADVGDSIVIVVEGSTNYFQTTITAVSSGTAGTLAAAPTFSSTTAFAWMGTDSSTQIAAWLAALTASNKCGYVPAGGYGAFSLTGLSGWITPCINGDNDLQSLIFLGKTSSLVAANEFWISNNFSDFGLFGGTDQMLNMYTGQNVSLGPFTYARMYFRDFISSAINLNTSDLPALDLNNSVFQGLNSTNTTCFALLGSDQGSIKNNQFLTCRFPIKLGAGGGAMDVEGNAFIQYESTGSLMRAAWIVPATTQPVNPPVWVHNKFGSEFQNSIDVRMLLADTQPSSGSLYFGDTLPTGTLSTGYVTNFVFDNEIFGQGGTGIPIFYSFTPNFFQNKVEANFGGTPPSQIIQFDSSVPSANSLAASFNLFGPFVNLGYTLPSPIVSNHHGLGITHDFQGTMQSSDPTVFSGFPSGASPETFVPQVPGPVPSFSIVGGGSKTTITDSLGGTNAATFTTGSAGADNNLFYMPFNSTPTLGAPGWCQIGLRSGSTGTSLTYVDIGVYDGFGPPKLAGLPPILLQSTWQHYKLPFTLPSTPTHTPPIFAIDTTAAATVGQTVDAEFGECHEGQEPAGGGIYMTPVKAPMVIGSSYAGTGTATFAPQAGAGTGATAVCATSHVCDSFSGEVTLTSGSVGTPATGSQLIITLPITRTNLPNCSVDLYGGSTFLGASKTVTTSTITISSGVALTFATAYTVDYVCGGN